MKINWLLRTRPRAKATHRSMVVKFKDKKTGKMRVVIYHDRQGNEMVKSFQYNPQAKEEKAFANLLRSIALAGVALPLKSKVAVEMIFCKDGIRLTLEEVEDVRPKGIRADITNYAKFVEDALNQVVWADDSQIVELRARFSPRCVDQEPDETEIRQAPQGTLFEKEKDEKVPF